MGTGHNLGLDQFILLKVLPLQVISGLNRMRGLPASVFRSTPGVFEIKNCDLKLAASVAVNWNAKSSGKRWEFRLTPWLRTLVVTPYNRARSASRMTRWPRIERIKGSSGSFAKGLFAAGMASAHSEGGGLYLFDVFRPCPPKQRTPAGKSSPGYDAESKI